MHHVKKVGKPEPKGKARELMKQRVQPKLFHPPIFHVGSRLIVRRAIAVGDIDPICLVQCSAPFQ